MSKGRIDYQAMNRDFNIDYSEDSSFPVVEQFVSINGEGRRAGQLAYFIRFAGCNLNCDYCDTKWANEKDVAYEVITEDILFDMIVKSGVKNITLTGGEPLLQPRMKSLLEELRTVRDIRVEIETNGSIDIEPFFSDHDDFLEDNVTFTLDYKTAVSGMEQHMCMKNYEVVRSIDTVKFVVGSVEDVEKAVEIVERYKLTEKKCGIYISPCFGMIEPRVIVEYITEHKLNDINVALQLHKYIWDADKRGV